MGRPDSATFGALRRGICCVLPTPAASTMLPREMARHTRPIEARSLHVALLLSSPIGAAAPHADVTAAVKTKRSGNRISGVPSLRKDHERRGPRFLVAGDAPGVLRAWFLNPRLSS
jgi:hypothetical protein